jgi:hypothetical protein
MFPGWFMDATNLVGMMDESRDESKGLLPRIQIQI